MRIRNEHIKVITDLEGIVSPETVRDFIRHFKEGIPFALVCEEQIRYYVLFPNMLRSVAWDGTEFTYNSLENMFDSVKLQLMTFPNFVSCGNMLEHKKQEEIEWQTPIILLNP